jgi:hypothetical protein
LRRSRWATITARVRRPRRSRGLCRHTLRTAWAYEREPSRVLETLNRTLLSERRERGRYATVVLATFEPTPEGVGRRVGLRGAPGAPPPARGGCGRGPRRPRHDPGLARRPGAASGSRAPSPRATRSCLHDGVSAGDEGRPPQRGLAAPRARAVRRAPLDEIASRLQAAAVRAQVGRPSDDVVIVAGGVEGAARARRRRGAKRGGAQAPSRAG